MKKTLRRIISIALALVLVLGIGAVSATAAAPLQTMLVFEVEPGPGVTETPGESTIHVVFGNEHREVTMQGFGYYYIILDAQVGSDFFVTIEPAPGWTLMEGQNFTIRVPYRVPDYFLRWHLVLGDDRQPVAAPNLDTASDWARDGINEAFELGLIPQALQNHYRNDITRAEFSALGVALYETATGREITGRMTFNDTDDVNAQKLAYLGVIQGTGGGNFSPNMQFNREQAAAILTRLANAIGEPFPQAAPTFADNAQMSAWARDYIGRVQAAGIMEGIGDNRFDPQGTFTREQSIITILELFDRSAN